MTWIAKLIEGLVLAHLVYQDEKYKEVWAIELVGYILFKIWWKWKLEEMNLAVSLFATALFLLIFIISKGGFGFGDVLLNLGLSLSYTTIYNYFLFFSTSFVLGSIYSIYLMMFKGASRKSEIPFMKFMVLAYYLT